MATHTVTHMKSNPTNSPRHINKLFCGTTKAPKLDSCVMMSLSAWNSIGSLLMCVAVRVAMSS